MNRITNDIKMLPIKEFYDTEEEYEKELVRCQEHNKLVDLENIESDLGITFKEIMEGHYKCFVSNGKDLIMEGKIIDVHIFRQELDICLTMPNKTHVTLTFSTKDKTKCIQQVRDFDHPITWALRKKDLL